jgi:hypothetical protein
MVHAMFEIVGSGVDGATIVSTSPGPNTVAVLAVNAAVRAAVANIIVPITVPFFCILKCMVPVAAVPAVARLPESPAGKVTKPAKTKLWRIRLAVGLPLNEPLAIIEEACPDPMIK